MQSSISSSLQPGCCAEDDSDKQSPYLYSMYWHNIKIAVSFKLFSTVSACQTVPLNVIHAAIRGLTHSHL